MQAQDLSYEDLDKDLTLPGWAVLDPYPDPHMTSLAPAQRRNTPHHSLQSSAHQIGKQRPNVGGDEEWMPRLQVHQPAQC